VAVDMKEPQWEMILLGNKGRSHFHSFVMISARPFTHTSDSLLESILGKFGLGRTPGQREH